MFLLASTLPEAEKIFLTDKILFYFSCSEVLSLAQETFEGFKLEVSRNFSEGFGINHSVSMGEHQQGKPPTNYTIMAHWTNRIMTMFGMMSTQGELRGRYMHELSSRFGLAAGLQISREKKGEESTAVDTEIVYKGDDFTSTARVGHQTAPQGEQTMYGFSYSQGVTENLALGLETAIIPDQNECVCSLNNSSRSSSNGWGFFFKGRKSFWLVSGDLWTKTAVIGSPRRWSDLPACWSLLTLTL